MTEKALDDYMKKADVEFRNILSKSKEDSYITISLITKYLFSCLVDADRLDARAFELSETIGKIENNHSFFSTSYNALLKHLETFENKTVIQKLRQEMSEQCDAFASNSSAIYRLSIPTGGGKTLASLRYALKHALLHQKQRIIYVVPFTTIIEQNAKIVRDILQNDTEILEHHSNVIENTAECDDDPKSVEEMHLNLMKDNWDAPIIFTTMVQYLNVFYNNGTRDVRRLHNLTDAVIIFDEVQAVPLKCITLFNDSVNFLKSICDVSVLLCTATQPALELVKNKLDIAEQSEIIANSDAVREQFKRVLVKDYTEDAGWSIKKLASFILMGMSAVTNILVVLNTKRAVAELYQELEKITTDSLYHLSTGMCAKHRQVTLAKIKADLKAKKRLICVSTPLIEAGVDISFQRVIRSLAGMDAIAQAAGRCNRHGEEEVQTVYIIKLQEKVEVTTALGAVHKGKNITKTILEQSKITNKQQTKEVELLSAKAMSNYFNVLFKDLDKELDYPLPRKNITLATLLGRNQLTRDAYKHTKISPYPYVLASSMKTSGANFNVIDDKTVAVFDSYIAFYKTQLTTTGLCYVTGKTTALVEKHPSKLRYAGDMAKLISANDTNGYTYRGLFSDKNQVATISYEASQKAHNALKWLITRQGKVIDGRVFLFWSKENLDVVSVDEDLASQFGLDLHTREDKETADTAIEFARAFKYAAQGYRQNLTAGNQVILLVLDAPTKGRLAVINYQKIDSSIYLENVQKWYEKSTWRFLTIVNKTAQISYRAPTIF